ncbi:MAG: hypothetical protein ABF258_03785 [Flavobacteriales bacterium]
MRIAKIFGVLAITILLSCSGNRPETTITDFFEAIKEKDFTKVKSLATEKSKSTLSLLESGVDVSLGNGKVNSVDCVTEGEIATCDCFMEGNEKPVPVSVVKENGEWKVDIQLTAKNMMNNIFDKLNDIDLSGLNLDGIDLENLDVEGIMENLGGSVEAGTNKINEFIKNIDADKISETLKGLDSNMGETSGNIENLLNQIKEGMGETNK